MTAEEFRRMALSLPEASEGAHMGHPDFRVGGKIFATLSPPGQGWAMVKLTREQQESFVQAEPKVFTPSMVHGDGAEPRRCSFARRRRNLSARRLSSPGVTERRLALRIE